MKKYLLMLFVVFSGMYTTFAQQNNYTFQVIGGSTDVQFPNIPEAMISPYSVVRVAYDRFDIHLPDGLNNGVLWYKTKILTQMKLPFISKDLYYYDGDPSPYDIWEDYFDSPARVPLDVAIYIRNSSKMQSSENFSVDTSSANGWVKVWDGYFDFEQNEIVSVKIDEFKTYPALLINFDKPFIYEGNILEIQFVNKSGVAPITIDENRMIKNVNKDAFPCLYNFLTYNFPFADSIKKNILRKSYAGTGIIWNLGLYFSHNTFNNRFCYLLKQDNYTNDSKMRKESIRPVIEFTCQIDTILYQIDTDINIGVSKPIKFSYPAYGNGYAIGQGPGYFPESIVSPYSTLRVGYSEDEMGKSPKKLTQIKLPYTPKDLHKYDHEHYGNSKPYNIWDTLYGKSGNVPLDVAIYLRSTYSYPLDNDPVDTSSANGWVKVWDGYFDFEQNEIVSVKIDEVKTYPALLINFDEPFLYTGGRLEIVFVNKSGKAPIIVDKDGKIKDINKNAFYCMYPFLTFESSDSFYEINGTLYSECMYFSGTGIIGDFNKGYNGKDYIIYNNLSEDFYKGYFAYRPMIKFTYQNVVIDTSNVADYKDLVLNITPNPVTNKINISFNSLETNTHIELLDISGSSLGIIYDGLLEPGNHTIDYDLSKHNLSNGTYFVKLVQEKNVQVKQFILAK